MINNSNLYQAIDLFMEYIEIVEGLPSRERRLRHEKVSARALEPNSFDGVGLEELEEEVEFRLIEIELPEEFLEEVKDVQIWEEDLSLYSNFNAFTGEWTFAFAPTKDVGFEIVGTDYNEVISCLTETLLNRIEWHRGNARVGDLDAEWEIFRRGEILHGENQEG